MLFSVIVPVYNRPQEIDELLMSLSRQHYTDFEVLIIDDGSEKDCRNIVDKYKKKLNIRYYYKENSGQGFSRNYGFDRAEGDYFVVFDSDCLIPPHYFETICRYLSRNPVDAWGGPDRAQNGFSSLQKAINYAMTSPVTTGGIRGANHRTGTFHPRSFNMGISRKVYQKTGGYKITRMGEDIEFSIRIIRNGFQTALIPDAYVYHKRRGNFSDFFRQVHFFGRARINIMRFYPDEIKLVHFLPALFVLGHLMLIPLLFIHFSAFRIFLLPVLSFMILLLVDSYYRERTISVAFLSIIASLIQITAYGTGFLRELYRYTNYNLVR